MKDIHNLVRKNILDLAPYSCARNEYSGHNAKIFLDANENPFNFPYNRYPDPLQKELKTQIGRLKQIHIDNIFLGNGSDEAIDLCFRIFCEPRIDNVVAIEPTYGMYRVCADINDIEYRPVSLEKNFQLNADKLLSACDIHTKIIWICSPNNPTGNSLDRGEITKVLNKFDGIVVIDEAYSDFSKAKPFRLELSNYPKLIILNTMSKAWGCAAIRLGMAFACKSIIELFDKVKYPYNVNYLTQQKAMEMLSDPFEIEQWIDILLSERTRTIKAFSELPCCKSVYPTDANFFLAKMNYAQKIYDYLIERGIIVRNRSRVQLCDDCLRVTIGTRNENTALIAALRQYAENIE